MPWGAAATVIGAGVSAYASNNAAGKATKAANNAADQNTALNREVYNQTRADLQPYAQAGSPALNALMQRAGIAGPPANDPGRDALRTQPAGPDYRAYFANNPDLGADPKLMRFNPGDLTGDGQVDNADRGAWHYQNYGQKEGRELAQAAPVSMAPPPVSEPAKAAGGNAGTTPAEGSAPNLMDAPRPAAAPAPTFQRPADQQTPTFTRPDDMARQDYGEAPDLGSYFTNFEASPDYQFRRQQGLDAANSGFAARGMLKSGAAAKGISDFASNLASAEYDNWFARQMQKYQAENSQYNTDRSFNESNFRYGQDRSDNVFTADRDYGTEAFRYGQGRADQNYENDRTFGTDAYRYDTNRNDNIFAEDRGYQTGRYDQQTSNLFGIAGIGQNAAAGTASAGNVFAAGQTASNNQRASTIGNAAIAGAGNVSNLVGQGLQAYGMYQNQNGGSTKKPAGIF